MTIDADRLKRAVHLDVEALEDGRFRVTGGAGPHVATADTCDCTDHRIHGEVFYCKHRIAVRLRRGDAEVIAELRKLLPPQQRKRRTLPAIPKREQPTLIPEAGALRLWRLEVERGLRTMYLDDDLRTASILEANARDEIRLGMIAEANKSRQQAAEILLRRFAKAVA